MHRLSTTPPQSTALVQRIAEARRGGSPMTTRFARRSIVALLVAALVSLAGAVLGGLAGMRFHRNVDKAGLGH